MEKNSIIVAAPCVHDNKTCLERRRLRRLLEQYAAAGQLILVTAGAGYGKTCAVSTFVYEYPARTIWLQLSERDNLPRRFWENFCRATIIHNPGLGSGLKEMGFPATERQFDRFLALMETKIQPLDRYIVVFDDFHCITDSAVIGFIERIIKFPVSRLCVILISRNESGLRLLSFLSKVRYMRITEKELRFKEEEIDEYLHMHNIDASREAIRDIYQDTEGWAFAVHLALLILQKSGLRYVRYSLKKNISQFIETELFPEIPETLQRFLIKLSLIDRWPLELLEQISGDPDLAGDLEKINSLIRRDMYLNTYEMHNLFVEFLKEKQGILTREEKQDVYNKTARWCFENNLKIDALSYYEKARYYRGIIEVVYSFPFAIPADAALYLLELLDRLNRSVEEEESLSEESKNLLPVLQYVIRAWVLTVLKRFDESTAISWEAITKYEVPAPPLQDRMILRTCYCNLGFIAVLTCLTTRVYEFASFFEKAACYAETAPQIEKTPLIHASLGTYVCWVGVPAGKNEFARFVGALNKSIPWTTKALPDSYYGMDDLARAELAFFQNYPERAEECAWIAVRKGKEKKQYEIEHRALFILIRVRLAQGDGRGICQIFEQMEERLQNQDFYNRYMLLDIAKGWFYAHIGETNRASSWLKNEFEESDLNSLINSQEILVKAKCFFAEKRYPAALAFLKDWKNFSGPDTFLLGILEMKVLEAVCLYYNKKQSLAFSALEEAYELSWPNVLTMPFIELGGYMRTLIQAYMKKKNNLLSQSSTGSTAQGGPVPYGKISGKDLPHVPPPEWLETIYRKSTAYGKKLLTVAEVFREDDRVPGPLSARELEVLISLSQGLTRAEIARDSNISLNTVKSTITRIYCKLNAVNRADAIRAATAMGLFTSDSPQ
jgi:LuxR family maltose regulon positive regulatory protein